VAPNHYDDLVERVAVAAGTRTAHGLCARHERALLLKDFPLIEGDPPVRLTM
jgi:hypothetical protein